MSRRVLVLLAAAVFAALPSALPAAPATALTGGPDGAGYTFTDSTEPGGPSGGPFASIAPANGGSGTDVGNHCDSCATNYQLPFPVAFHDQTTSIVKVSARGAVLFPGDPSGPAAIYASQQPLRTGGRGGNGIFALTSGAPGQRALTLEWRGVVSGEPTTRQSFQIVLHENSEQIDVRYLDVNASVDPGSLNQPGPALLHGGVGDRDLSYGYDVADGLAIRFDRPLSGSRTRTTLAVSPSSETTFGETVRLRATVRAAEPGAAAPTGSVTFYDDSSLIGTAPVGSTGVATFTTRTLYSDFSPVQVVARYDGDTSHRLSYSATLTHAVRPADSSATVKVPASGVVKYGDEQRITARIVVVTPGRAIASGSVYWYDDSDPLFRPVESSVANGRAVLPSTALARGDHLLRASYSGAAGIVGSQSSAVPVTVR